ncbi:MAG: D-alanyl-D-alanine carboxypeptidase family protein [Faecalibacterium sp.]
MSKRSLCCRAAALALTLVLAAVLALPGLAVYPMPIQTVSQAESVYLFNLDSGKPILEQNAAQSRYIASLTKMMTALLYLESGLDLNAEITIPTSLTQEFKDIQNANGTTMGLRVGETVRRIDLLYGLLVSSSNDAASAIASDMCNGDLAAFVSRMNARAVQLGCTDTNFTCVHGLYDYGNVSTARDLAKIAQACYANETYMQVASTLEYTLPTTNLRKNERTLKATNLMLKPEYDYYREYIRGMKTGFTTLAGRCYVTFGQQDGHTYGLVVLGSDLDNIYRESAELLDWAFGAFSERQLVDTTTELTTIPLTQCRGEESAALYAAQPLSAYGHPEDAVTFGFDLPQSVAATVQEGQVIGTATVYLDGYEVGTVELVTHQEYVSDFRTDTKSTLFLLAALVPALAVLGFLTLVCGGGSLNLRRRGRSFKKKF